MPLYTVKCDTCKNVDEVIRPVSRYKDLPDCCGSMMSRIITPIMFMEDIKAFKSPIDGSMIESRSSLKEHNIKHDVIQVGDEQTKPHKKVKDHSLRSDLKRVIHGYTM